jgi:hypothetical protein
VNSKTFDGRALAGLLLLNLLVHFVPFARPGFQPDDFIWLNLARQGEPWSFIDLGLSQGMRPLGSTLFMLLPKVLGLHETSQLLVLVATTSALTALGYLYLRGLFPRPFALLAAGFFVVWPVKHEIYASQLFGVSNLAACLVLGAGLFYRRWAGTADRLALAVGVVCYGLSIFIYEIGYLAPLLFYVAERSRRREPVGALMFCIPAILYWIYRLTHPEVLITIGRHDFSWPGLATGLTSLPSNLFGYQAARNVAYGVWGLWNGPAWFQVFAAAVSVAVGFGADRVIAGGARHDPRAGKPVLLGVGLASALLLAAPAALVLVESRHSILAALGMAIVLSGLSCRFGPAAGVTLTIALTLSAQGLALRQTEVSALQAAVYEHIAARRDQIREARVVVVDMSSLAERVSYTWGERQTNVLRSYWGLHAFSYGGLGSMVAHALHRAGSGQLPRIRVCATPPFPSEARIRCERGFAPARRPVEVPREGALIVDFKTMPLPESIPPR